MKFLKDYNNFESDEKIRQKFKQIALNTGNKYKKAMKIKNIDSTIDYVIENCKEFINNRLK
jgi:hypothetical protein